MSNPLPIGKEVYQETHNGMGIKGFIYNNDELEQSSQVVADVCFDAEGKSEFEDYVSSLSDTGFKGMSYISPSIKDWQVGEGFAEAYLAAHFSCCFPWSNNRDLKNLKSSLTGADMVGFHQGQFAFGEVKTSAEQKYPPQVTSKTGDGLNTQLQKICTDQDMRWVLVQYLYHRVKNTDEYREAVTIYLKDTNNFHAFGVLVRNVTPNINDWKYLKKHLVVHEQNKVSLIALYLPQNNGIKDLHARVLSHGTSS